jgi:hypothetical protein
LVSRNSSDKMFVSPTWAPRLFFWQLVGTLPTKCRLSQGDCPYNVFGQLVWTLPTKRLFPQGTALVIFWTNCRNSSDQMSILSMCLFTTNASEKGPRRGLYFWYLDNLSELFRQNVYFLNVSALVIFWSTCRNSSDRMSTSSSNWSYSVFEQLDRTLLTERLFPH